MTPVPSRRFPFSAALLRLALSRDHAASILGDLQEELSRREIAGDGPRWPRAWMLQQAIAQTTAAVTMAMPAMIRSWRHITRDAFRGLRASPATTAFAIAILALGIGAATVTFSIVDHVVLRRLPFRDSGNLVAVASRSAHGIGTISAPDFVGWRDGVEAFSSLAAVHSTVYQLTPGSADATPDALLGARVSASLFDVLAVPPLLGHFFTRANEIEGSPSVVVIGYGLWQRRFGGRADIIGQKLPLKDGSAEIVAVMPEGFIYPIDYAVGLAGEPAIWTPYIIPADEFDVKNGRSSYLRVVGRLRGGRTIDQARSQIDAVIESLRPGFPGAYQNWRPEVTTLYDSIFGKVRGWMLLILSAVTLVVVIACVNIASLLLTRAPARAREAAVRASLGATRRQLIAAMLVESLMLSISAAGLGVLASIWGLDIVRAALPVGIARAETIALDARVLGAAIAAAIATGLACGIVPAWQASRADVTALLNDGGSRTVAGRTRWRGALLVAEVAAIGVLLVSSALFVASFIRVTQADLGFERENLIAGLMMGYKGKTDDAAAAIRQVSGVSDVAFLAGGPPPLVNWGSANVAIRATDSVETLEAEFRRVTPDYFTAARVPIKYGRSFTPDEVAGSVPVVVLDEVAATRLFGVANAVGRAVRTGGDRNDQRVVGIATNVRLEGPEQQPRMQVYLPMRSGLGGAPHFVIRTNRPPEQVLPQIRAVLDSMMPAGRKIQYQIIDDAFRKITAERRFNAGLMLTFGLFALVIGAAGVYGVMASTVAQQTREIGVRVALGATRGRIVAWVLRATGRHLVTGLVIGLAGALAVSRIFASLLFQVTPHDVTIYLIVAAVLGIVGFAAALLPARRASRIDPIVVLRQG